MLFFFLCVVSGSDENNIYDLRFLIKPMLPHFHICYVMLQECYHALLPGPPVIRPSSECFDLG